MVNAELVWFLLVAIMAGLGIVLFIVVPSLRREGIELLKPEPAFVASPEQVERADYLQQFTGKVERVSMCRKGRYWTPGPEFTRFGVAFTVPPNHRARYCDWIPANVHGCALELEAERRIMDARHVR